MKNFFKITGIFTLSVLFVLYFAFLFFLPKQIDLNKYKPDFQKLVKENTDLTVDFDNVKVITSPLLEAGVKVKNIKVKLPDESVLFSADSFKGKVFLPELLWLTVRVSCAEVENPNLNVEIINSNKYKVAKVYEDLVNKKREQRRLNPPEALSEQENQIPFDISSIKLIIFFKLLFEKESTKYRLYPSLVIFNALFIFLNASSYSDMLLLLSSLIYSVFDISNLISFEVNSLFIHSST